MKKMTSTAILALGSVMLLCFTGRAEAQLWTPAEISTAAWYDADDAGTLTLDSGRVTGWADKSSNGHDASVALANAPTYTASYSGLNNMGGIGYEPGTTASRFIDTPTITGVGQIYFVVNWVPDAGWGGDAFGPSGTGSDRYLIQTLGGVDKKIHGKQDLTTWDASNAINAASYFRDGATTSTNTALPMASGALWRSPYAEGDAAYRFLNDNGASAYETWQEGALGEVIFTDGTEDLATQQKIEGYLAHKWGLDGDLPGDHPYKAEAPMISANAAPIIAGTVAGQNVDDNATIDPFSGVTIDDADGDPLDLTVTLSAAANGTLSGGGFAETGSGTGIYTYSAAAPAAATTAIQALTFTPTGGQVAPGNTVTTTFTISVDDGTAATVNDSTTTVIATSITLVTLPTSATWDYFHPTDGTDPAIADPDFDTTWYTQNDAGNSYDGPAFAGSGSGLFGYGAITFGSITEDIGTPADGNRYTAYFVTTFDLGANPANTVADLTADILADDGAFVYINGQLAGGINVDGISDTYLALTGPQGNETSLTNITLDKSLLIDGVNSIAVSVHQTDATSTDLGFQMEVKATLATGGGNNFSDWIALHPGVGGQTGLDQDPDGDGNDNGVENFFGTDPDEFSAGLIAGTVDTGAGTFTFTHPLNATPADDLTAVYRWSTDLQTFTQDGAPFEGTTVSFEVVDVTTGVATVEATITGTGIGKLFVDVEVTQP